MAHRSNQAVASQEQPASQTPADPPPPRRLLIGWTTALMALGVSTAALALAVWLLRFPIAEFMLGSALAERGAEADFQVVNLDFEHAVLGNVRFGAEASPDAAIDRVEARWRWSGLTPQLSALHLTAPRLRLRVDHAGRVSAGALDRLGGTPGRRRPSVPAIALNIEDGQAIIEAPFGAVTATFHGAGTLGTDFSGVARIEETTRPGDAHALEAGGAELLVVSRQNTIALRLNADARGVVWAGDTLRDAHVRIMGRAPLDLSRYDVEAAWRVGGVRAAGVSADILSGAAGVEAVARADSLEPQTWQGQMRFNASTLTLASNTMQSARFDSRIDGAEAQGQGHWTLGAERFTGISLISERPSANGAFTFDLRGDETATGQAQVSFAQARLNPSAQQRIHDAFPNLRDAPVGPTFARAEGALSAAAQRFDLKIPLALQADEGGAHISIVAPAEARAASGAVLRLAPLRQDTPGLVLQWPGPALHGGVALELFGGGAPSMSLLLDTLNWSPGAPFEADGTLSLSNWSVGSASIAANELAIGIAVAPGGAGRVDLTGPARITGPLGDGEVRELVTTLDVGILWQPGWRVETNHGCLPVQLGGLDAAGLSFANGAFALCPLNGALIAADAQRNLSGGFVIQSLALNGRMSGPDAQPARLSASNVMGRFRGRTGDMTLAIEADAPGLSIRMAPDRTLSIALQRLTADAHVAESWRVDGAFEQGVLSDPTLPGSVSTIAGRWRAAPEDGKPIIRIDAGEARLTANRPASEAERPLFNPLRLIEVAATLRNGRIEANGAIALEDGARQLARFTAEHEIDEGAGVAHVTANELEFGPNLQPYDITERARGLVDNVRGPAAFNADINWTRDAITSTGTVRLNGVSLATSTIPIVQDVRGDITFDDLFALTTPPDQQVTIGALNPGVTVHNGDVRFQLLPEERVAIERAEFEFAAGVLAMTPTTIRLGADSTEFELTLHDVAAADLITSLNIADLTATGRVEGSFPLVLSRTHALIRHGTLRALPGGGTISYTGSAGEAATGPSRIAFDALRNFRYDELSLVLDGDLSGDVVSSIEFSGHNSGEAVDLGPIVSLPGVGRVTVRGVPFDFNVHVTAPFSRLARTAASITDPGLVLEQRRAAPEAEPQEPVDPEPSTPR